MNKKRNNLILSLVLIAASLAFAAFGQSYSVPSPISAYDVAVWANRGGFIASGTAAPSAAASEGALYIDNAVATQPTLYRYGSGAWAVVAGGGGGGSGVSTHSQLLGLSFAESGHTGFASEPALNDHIADQIDPHGASMTISQEVIIGDPEATQTVYIDSPAAGIARIASYIQLVYENAAPIVSSSAVTIWADNASKTVYFHNGSDWTNLGGTYGGIHCHDNSSPQSVATGTTYATVTALIDSQISNDVLVSTSTQSITINRAGVYRISFNISFYTDTNNIIGYFAAFQNGSELDNIHLERKIGTGADVGSSAASGFARLAAGDKVSLRVRHNHTSAVAFTITYANLNVERIGN